MLQKAAASNLRSLQDRLESQGQQQALLHSVLRTISSVMPATSAQRDRWQEEEKGQQQAGCGSAQPQEVLEQVQSYIQSVQAQHDR